MLRVGFAFVVLVAGCPKPVDSDPDNDTDGDADPDVDTDADTERDTEADDGCDGDDECGAFEICWDECEPALDRSYTVTIIRVDGENLDENGQYWDFGGGAPDFGVEWGAYDDNAGEFTDSCYEVADVDAFASTMNESCSFTLASGHAFRVVLWEEDTASYDFVHSWTWDNNDELTALARRSGGPPWNLEGDAATVRVEIDADY